MTATFPTPADAPCHCDDDAPGFDHDGSDYTDAAPTFFPTSTVCENIAALEGYMRQLWEADTHGL